MYSANASKKLIVKAVSLAIVIQLAAICPTNGLYLDYTSITNYNESSIVFKPIQPNLLMNTDESSEIVGVCHESSDCDDINFEWPKQTNKSTLIVSSMSGKRFAVSSLDKSDDRAKEIATTIDINLADKKQPIMGWGGAFTDAACQNIKNIGDTLGEKIMQSYFGPKGLRYNFGRVPIGGSDFSARAYTYDDSKDNMPDFELKNWVLANEDFEYKIPVILRAMQLAGPGLKLFASPWSPPAWMKTSKSLTRGHLIDNDQVYETYARYLIKFFDAYEQMGIKFWGATVQNEPGAAYLPFYFFNSLQFSSEEMIRFVGKFYGPALKASNRTRENFKLMVGDDNLGFINSQVPTIMNDPNTAQYISGLAFHWYTSGLVIPYSFLDSLYDQIKDKIEFVMMSEACTGSMPASRGVRLGDWGRAESYASDIIEDLLRHTSSWIDWNMVLDIQGGPNWSKNFVDSPIIVDTDKKLFYKQPMYYALAHFSRLFPPGCRVLHPTSSKSIRGLSFISCHIEETNHVVVNILNTWNKNHLVDVSIGGATRATKIQIEPRSITSVLVKL